MEYTKTPNIARGAYLRLLGHASSLRPSAPSLGLRLAALLAGPGSPARLGLSGHLLLVTSKKREGGSWKEGQGYICKNGGFEWAAPLLKNTRIRGGAGLERINLDEVVRRNLNTYRICFFDYPQKEPKLAVVSIRLQENYSSRKCNEATKRQVFASTRHVHIHSVGTVHSHVYPTGGGAQNEHPIPPLAETQILLEKNKTQKRQQTPAARKPPKTNGNKLN